VSEQTTDAPADHPGEGHDDAGPTTASGAAGPSPRRIVVVGTLVALLLAVGAGALVAMSLSDDDPEQLGDGPAQADLVPIDEGEIIGLPIAEPYLTFDGGEANTAAYIGTPLVINFFAEWCAPCVAEMPAFEEVHQERLDQVAFLGISTQETSDDGQAIIDSTGITYDVGRDPDGEMFATFGGTGMPTTALVDQNGTVVDVHSGALTADELREWLDESFGTG
jgi:cytochrome c biogenesis protein CcmG, thiol:disulfide interchange protein DsbE